MFLYCFMFILTAVMMTAGMLLSSRVFMHYFQLESYQFQGYFRTLRRQLKRAVVPHAAAGIMMLVCAFVFFLIIYLGHTDTAVIEKWVLLCVNPILAVLSLISGFFLFHQSKKKKEKKALVITARMKRLFIIHGILLLILTMVITSHYNIWFSGILFACLPLLFAVSAVLALPIEKLIFYLYFRDAQKKLLENDHLIRIGITGSYGKTSVKFILNTILSQKYNVLCTPSSFNTPMGVTRIVRERLDASHQIFIGEMGARHVGEIKELCNLVHPSIGILTAVGPQHLDTFRTLDRIKKTKYELIEALPKDGFAVFSNDNGIVKELYDKTAMDKAIVGMPGDDAWADNVKLSGAGSTFTLHLKDEEPFSCQTVLLGEHNIQNILMCCAVALKLGLSRQQIARGITALKPVEHRLQLLRSAGGITVIDDAFNTNPNSSQKALNVLKAFSRRRIIVTPGMVELGDEEAKFNHAFGEQMASCTDWAFLVGKKHTQPIYDGLIEKGFDPEHIVVTGSLSEATAILNPMMRENDVILYENDLPDHYSET